MSVLADALEAYEHAIAVGAPWRVQAERFVDLTSAHRARMVELYEAGEAEFRPDECNGSWRCDVTLHFHGCHSDFGQCDEPAEHEATP